MFEQDDGGIDQLFAGVLEIDRDAMAIDRLYLSEPPVGTLGMEDKIAGCESSATDVFMGLQRFRRLPIFIFLCMVRLMRRCEKHCLTGGEA